MINLTLDARVSTALQRNPHVTGRNLHFQTDEGRVTLQGVVDSYYEKQMAQEALRHIDGINEIANEVEVCWAS